MRFIAIVGWLLLTSQLTIAADPKTDISKLPVPATVMIDFDRDIQPIFARACLKCHGAEKQRGGFRLDDARAALEGGNSGKVILPGKSAESPLVHAVARLDADTAMPTEGPALSRDEVSRLRAWIDQGAKWGKSAQVVGGPNRSTHWAFQPIRRPDLPTLKDRSTIRNGIDAFILARLEKEGIAPAPEADRATLIRRVSLDLIGLPPTAAEVDAFLADPAPDAYERLVDRLLASPHYGERWGRHWLDAARYADSDGYEKDTGRPFAYRYRDWVIQAFNRDLPYDQFTVEQLAGDLLPSATIEQKMATGFHRNTLTNKEGGVDQEQFRVEQCVDRVNTTARVFMGLTLGCAQCHDHKYDPLSQREYFQFFAYFNSDQEVNLPAPLPGELERLRPAQEAFTRKRADLEKAIADYRAGKGGKVAKDDPELAKLVKSLNDHNKTEPQSSPAPTLALGPTRKTNIMIRGDFLRPGIEVQAGVPNVLTGLQPPPSADRLGMARWLVQPDHPLTARVSVNWIWQKYFGRGLVNTLEDFGTQGEKPSHPELLDWLARQFMDHGWSMKSFHRLIVTSATYRQSSAFRPELRERDPLNILLARQSRLRLEAEIIRDVALHASGLLAPSIGGPSVRPPQPAGISELTYAGSARWAVSGGADRYRRGLYIWFQRTSPFPMLMTFDEPDSNLCSVRREKSNTPLQALTLMNDVVFVECAQALGQKVLRDQPSGNDIERIHTAFRCCLSRTPSAVEVQRLQRLLIDFRSLAEQNPANAAQLVGKTPLANVPITEQAAWIALGRTLLNLDECITRE